MRTLLLYLGNCSPKNESEGESGCRAVSEKEKETQIIETNRKKQVGGKSNLEDSVEGNFQTFASIKGEGRCKLS